MFFVIELNTQERGNTKMNINQATLKEFRADFQEAVKSLESKYGVVINAQKITYSSDSFSFKVEVQNGTSHEDVNKTTFNKYCVLYGLEESDFGRVFKQGGEEFQIVGINPSKRKNNIVIKNTQTGSQYICPPNFIPFVREKREAGVRHMHTCKYCGGMAEGDNEDLLCPECQEAFGHKFYSEL